MGRGAVDDPKIEVAVETPRRIRQRLVLAFAVGGLLIVAVSAWSLFASGRTTGQLADDLLDEARDLALVERLRFAAFEQAAARRAFLHSSDRSYLVRADEAHALFSQLSQRLRPSLETEMGRSLLVQVDALNRIHSETFSAAQRLVRRGATREQITRFHDERMRPVLHTLKNAAERFASHKERKLEQAFRSSINDARTAVLVSIAVTAVSVLCLLVLGWRVGGQLADAFAREQNALRKTREAVDSRDEILRVVSHDLRNALSVAGGNAQLLAQRIKKQPDAHATHAKHAHYVKVGVDRATQLIESLLDPASAQSGKFTVAPGHCTVREILALATTSLEAETSLKGLSLDVRCDAPDELVSADRGRIVQVLANIVGNAIKFSPPEETIRLECVARDEEVIFSVTDAGPGIPPDQVPHIFDRHWRAPGQTHGGLGLGLYICLSIVEAHGGRIWAENDEHGGARISFALPRLGLAPPATYESLRH